MGRLDGKRVLVTQADDYMGPITLEVFAEEGAEVIADSSDLTDPSRARPDRGDRSHRRAGG